MENVLEQLVKYRENDLLKDIEANYATEETRHHITELIIGITRYIHDIRYCSKKICPCSPEHHIKLHYDKVEDFIKGSRYALHPIPWRDIEEALSGVDGE